MNLAFAPFLCSMVLCWITQPQLTGFWKWGLVLGLDFYEQCSVDIVLCACRSLSKESNWGVLLGPELCAHSALPDLARLFSRVFFPIYIPISSRWTFQFFHTSLWSTLSVMLTLPIWCICVCVWWRNCNVIYLFVYVMPCDLWDFSSWTGVGGSNPGLWQWELRILTPGQPENSLLFNLYIFDD